jgi:hypothetical protein
MLSNRNLSFLFGIIVSFFVLNLTVRDSADPIRLDEFAVGKNAVVIREPKGGNRIHCNDINDADECVLSASGHKRVTLWLGNSQLHTVNQPRPRDKLASLYLHEQLLKHGRHVVTFSQPNANLQEHYVLFANLLDRFSIDTLILPVVFDDFREDGLRAGINKALDSKETRRRLERSSAGQYLIDQSRSQGLNQTKSIQQSLEQFLNKEMEDAFQVWKTRGALQGEAYISLYKLRNWMFNIKPSSIRKMIPYRYELNMNALNAILNLARREKVKVLLYVAPLRQDILSPYNAEEYADFIEDVGKLVERTSVRFLNLAKLVPASLWGEKASTSMSDDSEIDFMHFTGLGHQVLSERLYVELLTL